jgi:hypothetical protein
MTGEVFGERTECEHGEVGQAGDDHGDGHRITVNNGVSVCSVPALEGTTRLRSEGRRPGRSTARPLLLFERFVDRLDDVEFEDRLALDSSADEHVVAALDIRAVEGLRNRQLARAENHVGLVEQDLAL